MIEVRCKKPGCNKLLAMAESMNAAIKCPWCRQIYEYKIYTDLTMYNERDYINTETPEVQLHNRGSTQE